MIIGGVPEHYNAPFQMVLEESPMFEWISFPGGTGAMLEALDKGEIDVAVVLTEGAVKHALGCGTKILGTFVESPLPWGVHVSAGENSSIQSMAEFNEKISQLTFGVSRFGSGSHLMAIVHAAGVSDSTNSSLSFKVVRNMSGAADAMNSRTIDAFLWDIPTADKYTREGVWKVVGTVAGNWPAFVFVSRGVQEADEFEKVLESVKEKCNLLMDPGRRETSIEYLQKSYGLLESQAREFLSTINWSCTNSVSIDMIAQVSDALVSAKILPERPSPEALRQITPNSALETSHMYDWRVAALRTWIEKQLNKDGPLSMEVLSTAGHLDQYHYLGLAANDAVIGILGIDANTRVLDVGCGVGGPARYFAWKTGCQVTGIDIQPGLVKVGNWTTDLVGLRDKVQLVCGDVCDDSSYKDQFDVFVSLLVILHIADRKKLFNSLFTAVKPGGGFLIDDMVSLATPDSPFSEEEERIAKTVIGAPNLPTIAEYRTHLDHAGFVDIEFEDLTSEWVQWAVDRSIKYDANEIEQIAMYGEKVFAQRSAFYQDVKNIFLGKKLGGARITGRKPTNVEKSLVKHRMGGGSSLEKHVEYSSNSNCLIIEQS